MVKTVHYEFIYTHLVREVSEEGWFLATASSATESATIFTSASGAMLISVWQSVVVTKKQGMNESMNE